MFARHNYQSPLLIKETEFANEHRLIQRLLALRRAGKIGPVICDQGKYAVSTSELRPRDFLIHLREDQLETFISRCESERDGETEERNLAEARRA